jgi:hypothetical protein
MYYKGVTSPEILPTEKNSGGLELAVQKHAGARQGRGRRHFQRGVDTGPLHESFQSGPFPCCCAVLYS